MVPKPRVCLKRGLSMSALLWKVFVSSSLVKAPLDCFPASSPSSLRCLLKLQKHLELVQPLHQEVATRDILGQMTLCTPNLQITPKGWLGPPELSPALWFYGGDRIHSSEPPRCLWKRHARFKKNEESVSQGELKHRAHASCRAVVCLLVHLPTGTSNMVEAQGRFLRNSGVNCGGY